VKNLCGTVLGFIYKGLEYLLNGLAHFQDESLRLFGITLEVLTYTTGKLTQGGLELAFKLLGLGIQMGFVLN
jgi:hypothetical protein